MQWRCIPRSINIFHTTAHLTQKSAASVPHSRGLASRFHLPLVLANRARFLSLHRANDVVQGLTEADSCMFLASLCILTLPW
jgi:hypothetical protein